MFFLYAWVNQHIRQRARLTNVPLPPSICIGRWWVRSQLLHFHRQKIDTPSPHKDSLRRGKNIINYCRTYMYIIDKRNVVYGHTSLFMTGNGGRILGPTTQINLQ